MSVKPTISPRMQEFYMMLEVINVEYLNPRGLELLDYCGMTTFPTVNSGGDMTPRLMSFIVPIGQQQPTRDDIVYLYSDEHLDTITKRFMRRASSHPKCKCTTCGALRSDDSPLCSNVFHKTTPVD